MKYQKLKQFVKTQNCSKFSKNFQEYLENHQQFLINIGQQLLKLQILSKILKIIPVYILL